MSTLFEDTLKHTNFHPLGNAMAVKLHKNYLEIWRNGAMLFTRELDYREKTSSFRLLVVELCLDFNAQKTKLSAVFGCSRQTIDNWIDSYQKYGVVGLENSTKNKGNSNRTQGNKAIEHARERARKKTSKDAVQLSIEDMQVCQINDIKEAEGLYQAPVEKQANRYAGVFAVIMLLISEFAWFNWIIGYFGKGYRIFQLFVFMSIKNIRSIEQLKNVRLGEAGAILGIGKIPSLPLVWEMFYTEAKKGLSLPLINAFFRWQIASSQVRERTKQVR